MAHGVWIQRWEESERGWGVRNDGCFLYPTKEAAEKDTKRIVASYRKAEAKDGYGAHNVPDEYTRPAGEPRFVEVTLKVMREVKKKGRVFSEKWL